MSRDTVKLEHPSCLFVYPPRSEDGRFEFQLPFFPQLALGLSAKPGRIFTLNRPASENFTSFSSRLIDNINKYLSQSKKKNKEGRHAPIEATDISLDGSQWQPSDTLEAIFSQPKSMQLRMSISAETPKTVIFDVLFNSARLNGVKLDLLPFVGCPFCPAIAGENLDLEKSKFEWSVSLVSRSSLYQFEFKNLCNNFSTFERVALVLSNTLHTVCIANHMKW